jgi:glycosyltransferase involved in cell wall biosynthesis
VVGDGDLMDERVTVLFTITDLPRDGAQRQLLELVRGLDKKRFRPVILTLRSGGSMEPEFKEVPYTQVISLERKGKYDFLYLFRVFRLLRRLKVDVVQPFLTPATFFGLLPALLCHTPLKIVTERSGVGRGDVLHGYRLYLRAEDFLTRFADLVVANSEAGKEYLIGRGIAPKRVKVIYNGLNLTRLNSDGKGVGRVKQMLNLPANGQVVGIVARLYRVKRHDTFLLAAALVSQAISDVRFAIVGDGPSRSYLEELSQELGLASKVVFFGEQREVGPYLAACDVAVLTSETEGCSNSVLEAMAVGKPVVATNVGGNRELIDEGETGFLVPPGDQEALAEAIIRLLRKPILARAMGQRARERTIRRFSLESMVNQYESLYEAALKRRSGKKSSTVGQR